MQYLGHFETIEIDSLSSDYIKGFLHCISMLNEPETTLTYSYDILMLPSDGTLLESLKKSFHFVFQQEALTLTPILKEELQNTLTNWFFKFGELRKEENSIRKIENTVSFCTNALLSIIKPISIYQIDNLSDDVGPPYALGIAYNYYVLESGTRRHLLYFRYDD